MLSWGEELWRFCGGKTVYIPSTIVLFGLYFRSIDMRRPCVTLNFAVCLSAINITLSGQRTAAIALFYLLAMFGWYSRAAVKVVLLLFAVLLLVVLRDEFQTVYDMTFGLKLELVSKYEFSRADIWAAAADCLTQSPKNIIFGVSEGGLPLAHGSNYRPEFSNNPHSLLLYVWASSGILGVVSMSVAVFRIGQNAHFESKMYKITLFWGMLGYFCFAGFGLFSPNARSDFLNIALIVLVVLIFTNDSCSRRPSLCLDKLARAPAKEPPRMTSYRRIK
jgi:O-antigen ligase